MRGDYTVKLKGTSYPDHIGKDRVDYLTHIVATELSGLAIGILSYVDLVERATSQCETLEELFVVATYIESAIAKFKLRI